jgi:hypothetical protein
MATIHQIDADRRTVVTLKPLRDGLRARTVVLPEENRQEFHQLCDDLEAEWNPRSRTEQFYLEQMAVNQWKLTRLEVGEINIFKKDGDNIRLLDRLWQAQCRMERSYARAQRELERLQATRRRQPHQRLEAVPLPQPVAEAPSAASAAVAVGKAASPAQSRFEPIPGHLAADLSSVTEPRPLGSGKEPPG